MGGWVGGWVDGWMDGCTSEGVLTGKNHAVVEG